MKILFYRCFMLVMGDKLKHLDDIFDGYYVAYEPITLPCILFMFIEMKFIHCHSCVIFIMNSMNICND